MIGKLTHQAVGSHGPLRVHSDLTSFRVALNVGEPAPCDMAILIQRPLKGSRISSFYPVKSLPPLSALDSAFQLQEYISLLIRLDVHDVDRIVSIPGKGPADSQDNGEAKGDDKEGEKDGAGGVNVDEACWVYEQLRCVPTLLNL